MTTRLQQIFAPAILGAALVTSVAVVVPQLVAAPTVPAVAEIPAVAPTEPANLDVVLASDEAVDMNHWQETGGGAGTPYVPGGGAGGRKGK